MYSDRSGVHLLHGSCTKGQEYLCGTTMDVNAVMPKCPRAKVPKCPSMHIDLEAKRLALIVLLTQEHPAVCVSAGLQGMAPLHHVTMINMIWIRSWGVTGTSQLYKEVC